MQNAAPQTDAHEDPRDCPASVALGLIANKWSVKILYTLAHAPETLLRFREIQRRLTPITQRELTKHLRAFEEAGLVRREVYPEVPPRVEYSLTPLGLSLCDTVNALSEWASKNGAQIQANRTKFQKSRVADK
ncbi:MAG: helix-turn-helix transcriptional regulator [Alphaproteobacteria bacterium]|nr:helix-turn-helix transcriptional regulator [Alphaproteobacteria bacterium]